MSSGKKFFAGNIFKIGSVLGLSSVLLAGLLWWKLPLSVARYVEVRRGTELSHQVAAYQRHYKSLPSTGDWPTLKQLGFTADELARAYPEYVKLDSITYQLTFAEGFDGPYLMWNSNEQQWKSSFPAAVSQ